MRPNDGRRIASGVFIMSQACLVRERSRQAVTGSEFVRFR